MGIDPKEYTYLWKDRIVSHPEILGGKPIIKGTRLSVEFVADEMRRVGVTEDSFLREFSHIDREDIYACLEYASTGSKLSIPNRADLDRRMDEEDERKRNQWLAEWKKKNAPAG